MTNSYRQVLRSTSIIGGASVVNILVGLLRMKVAAMLLGPAGVGLIGLLTNLVNTASGISGLGVGKVGTRQIAEAAADGDPYRVAVVRHGLLSLTFGLAVLGGAGFWALRGELARWVLGDTSMAVSLGWLSIAISLSVASASQVALLNGMRRIGDIARLTAGSAVLSTLAAIGALWWWGKGAVVAFVMAAPVFSFLLGHWYVSKLPRAIQMPGKRVDTSGEWRAMVRLGFAFMVAGLATTVGQLAIRTLLQRKLGIDALGQFQAAWMISMVYVGFVLGAMGTDYYPRLTAVIKDPGEVNRLVNEQTEIALLLAAPVLIAMLALSPWVVRVLYSSDFGDAAEILRWQVLGDILKVLSWPLGFVLLASGRGKTFICTEWLAMGLFFSLTYLLLPILLVAATGASFFAMYAVYLAAVWLLAVKQTAFAWSRNVKRYAVIVFIAGLALHALTEISSGLAAILGVIISATFGFVAVTKVSKMIRTKV